MSKSIAIHNVIMTSLMRDLKDTDQQHKYRRLLHQLDEESSKEAVGAYVLKHQSIPKLQRKSAPESLSDQQSLIEILGYKQEQRIEDEEKQRNQNC